MKLSRVLINSLHKLILYLAENLIPISQARRILGKKKPLATDPEKNLTMSRTRQACRCLQTSERSFDSGEDDFVLM
jgi:hypothetical protein